MTAFLLRGPRQYSLPAGHASQAEQDGSGALDRCFEGQWWLAALIEHAANLVEPVLDDPTVTEVASTTSRRRPISFAPVKCVLHRWPHRRTRYGAAGGRVSCGSGTAGGGRAAM